MVQVLALEIDLRAAEMVREPVGEIERRRPADVMLEIAVHLRAEGRVVLRRRVGALQVEDQRHQRLGDEAAAVEAEVPALVRPGAEGIDLLRNVHAGTLAERAARMKARIFSGSFTPGADSTPEETSTPPARVMRSASATLSALSPPESMNGIGRSRFSSRRQSKGLPRPPGRVASRGARASNSRRSTIFV